MNRRTFLKKSAVFIGIAGASPALAATSGPFKPDSGRLDLDTHIKDRLIKSRHFDTAFSDDIFLASSHLPLLKTSLARLKKLQSIVGYGNFALISLDQAIAVSRAYPQIGAFSKPELDFLEMLFYSRVKAYGFMGEKPIKTITGKINKKDVTKIPHTGNYLYRGKPVEMYKKITQKIGHDVILTSGVRSVMKQFLLFLNKAQKSGGNLSMASRSLAPPGYSFHGVGDFDVGQKGYGIDNFTERFTQTKVYQRLENLGYIRFRYDRDNHLGVRYEPWHIEVI